MVQVNQGDRTTSYHYDAFNRRISKTHNEATTNYLYQDQNEIGAYVNDDLKELRILGMGQGAVIGAAYFLNFLDKHTYPPTTKTKTFLHYFTPVGDCLETYRYIAFGEELASSNISNPWRFSSKRHDPETGFLYFGQRYYAADLGRWIIPDPLEFEDGPNLYAYVHNNPITSIDLYGLFDGVEDYEFSYRSSYSDFDAYRCVGAGIGNAAYSLCFGNGDPAVQNNTPPIDGENEDWRKSLTQSSERVAKIALPIVAGLAASYIGVSPAYTAC